MPERIKAARTLLGISQQELCDLANIPLITLRRIEGKNSHKGLVSEDTVQAIMLALETQGVQFLNGGEVAKGDGIAMKKDSV